jgi:hypothetical protein
MSTPSFPYFHTANLRQRYVDELEDALHDARLSAVECHWLQALIRPQRADDLDPVRIDRLIAANPLHRHAELSGALLLSHGLTDVSEVYLYTLGLGLEVFADRSSLLTALRNRYAAGDEAAIFEYEKIDGNPFEAQMLALVDHQAERVGTLTARLKQTPGWLEDSTGSTAETLAEVSRQCSTRLASFWRTVEGASPHRDLAIEAFENSLRDRVYRREAAGLLTPEVRKALCSVLHLLPGQGTFDSHLRCYRLALRVGDSAACSLAGTFVVKPTAGAEGALFWYSPDHQWHSFADTVALTAYFATPEGRAQAAYALALSDHVMLQREGEVRIGFAELQTRPCELLIDTILALQARNLMYALTLPQRSEKQAAMIDDALDIRQLLDPRQLCFSAGRWRRQAPFDFMSVWQRPASSTLPSASVSPTHEENSPALAPLAEATAIVSVPSWRDLTRDFDRRTTELRQLDNTLQAYAEQALQRYLCVWSQGRLNASNVHIQWQRTDLASVSTLPTVATQDIETLDLMSLLLERVTGRCGPELPAGARVRVDNPTAPGQFPVALVEHLLRTLTPDFVEGYVRQFEASRREGQRHGDRPLQPEREALKLREDAMRLYAALATRQKWIVPPSGDLIRQMLDQPAHTVRSASHPEAAEAFEVWLTYGDASSVRLCDAMVLQSPQPQARSLVFWSSLTGWRSFRSGARLQRMLQSKLAGAERDDWLQLLSERDRVRLERHLAQVPDSPVRVRLDRIDGNALDALQEGVLQRQLQDVRQLCLRARRCRFDAQLFSQLAGHCDTDASLCSLIDGLSVRIETSLFEALLPPWLSEASIADLGLYCDLLKRYYEATDGGKDFLIGVSSLHGYARAQLRAGLEADFPGLGFKPDDITITSREFVSAFPPTGELPSGVPAATITHTESLTEYAINRFANHQSAILSVTSEVYPQAAETMTVNYVRQLVRRLNIGAGYVALLREALTPTDALYETRNQLFVNQLPPMLMAVALAQKLKGELSPAAFDLVVGVLDMPDGLAREPIHGVRAMISPVRLVADAGMTPDPVSGVYLIGAGGDESGVHVLYAMHDSTFTFREYASLSALHEAIRTDASLQQLLLARVEPSVHRRYDHGGFIEPHLPFSVEGLGDLPFRAPGPVTVDVSEVKGNAVQYLFNSAVKLLLELIVANTVTNEQEDQAGRTFLATLGFEQLVSLLPSKLSAMVTLWQGQTLLRASAASASGRHWGEAFSEFSAALGVMVTAREQSFQEQVRDDRLGGDGLTEDQEAQPSAFSWRNTALDAGQKLRLKGLEARGVALADLRHDHLLNLFTDTVNGATYAVVKGRVYQVRRIEAENNWIIVGADGTTGPKLVMDINQRWHLDLTLRLRGGGAVVTKMKEGKIDKSAKDILVIEARGMPEIRQLYRDRARRIGQAHIKAKRYLETCLDNLSPHQNGQPLDPQVTRIIADYFGVTVPDKALLDETLNTAKTLYSAIMDPSLSPYSSPRFVIGSTRPGHEMVTAFVIKTDPKQRLYLTEQFFVSPSFFITPAAVAQGFSVDVHHRAANLIHELSHLTLDTHDIAYLESMAPYPDLLLNDTPFNTRVRDSVERLHTKRLSHLSDRDALFTLMDSGTRRDLEPEDGRGFETILKVTGAPDLDDARDVFLADAAVRSRLILSNADSVTLLLLLLGRRSFGMPSP